MAVRVVVREPRVVDELDAGGAGLDQEQRRQPLGAVDDVGHHDQHAGDVARGHEPLLAVDPPAAVRRDGGRGDAARVRAGLGLGDRVGVAALAAQRRDQVALDLLGRALEQDVVGARHVPVETVRDAAELLVDQEPLEHRPPLAAVLGGEPAAVQPRRDRLALDRARPSPAGSWPPSSSASSSSGISTRLDERPRSLLELELIGRELVAGGRGEDGGAHGCSSFLVASSCASRRLSVSVRRAPRPGSASSRLWWLAITAIATSRARATSGSASPARARSARRRRAGSCPSARSLPRRTSRSIRAASSATGLVRSDVRRSASVATAAGSSRSGSGVTDSQGAA